MLNLNGAQPRFKKNVYTFVTPIFIVEPIYNFEK